MELKERGYCFAHGEFAPIVQSEIEILFQFRRTNSNTNKENPPKKQSKEISKFHPPISNWSS